MAFERITVRPDQMGGVPCIRALRIPVSTVVRMVANGLSTAEILDHYPDLEAQDVREALLYAAACAEYDLDDHAMALAVRETRAHRRERGGG